MRLHVLSDLHLEHAPFVVPEVEADAVLLAGDTAPGVAGIEWAQQAFPPTRPVLYIAGNHEFYGQAFPAHVDKLRVAAEGSHVHVLENDELVIGQTRFLGCTLWTDFDSAGAERRAATMRFAERASNDYRLIDGPRGGPLRASDTRRQHLASRAWLTGRLAEPHSAGPTVVLTHHVPVARRRTQNLVLQALGGTVVSDLSELIGAEQVSVWIYGHNHRAVDVELKGTRLFSNPRGYPHDPVDGFNPAHTIEV